VRTGNFPSYFDAYKKAPYVYFSSMSRGSRANAYDPTPHSLGVSPYVQSLAPSTTYFNPTTFQIISAGLDGQFGPGSTVSLTPLKQQAYPYPLPKQNQDDMANFNDSAKLGSPQ